MARRREIYINGVKVRFGKVYSTGGLSPSQNLIDELVSYFHNGTPWNGHFIMEYTPEALGLNCVRHNFKMISRKAPIG